MPPRAPRAPESYDPEGARVAALPGVDVGKHPLGVIFQSQSDVKVVAFTVDRTFFHLYPNYQDLPLRMRGEAQKWVRTGVRLNVSWPHDKSDTLEDLDELLKLEYHMKLESIGTKGPAKPKGSEAKRRYIEALSDGAPYKSAINLEIVQRTVETVSCKYQEGAFQLEQVWEKHDAHHVQVDWRQEPAGNFRQKIKLPREQYNTLQKMLFSVGLPMNLARKCVEWFNERMPKPPANAKENNLKYKRWTVGEIVANWGAMIAATLVPGVPTDDLFGTESVPGDLFEPIALGRHGVKRARHRKFKELACLMFSVNEDELKTDDPWRYSRPPIEAYNQWRQLLIEPSYALVGDEAMAFNLSSEEGVS